jgi:[acyl-carrier-protein] S-malonyltransferase
MQEVGIPPHFSAGHSLGEISALIAAGAFAFADGLRFVRKRGDYMQQAFREKKGNMGLAVNLPEDVVRTQTDAVSKETGFVQVSGFNSPGQFLVSGTSAGITAFSRRVKALKGEFYPFKMVANKVDAPFHCSLMDFIREPVEKELSSFSYAPLRWPVIANVTGLPYNHHNEIKENLSRQLVSPVKWYQGLCFMEQQGVTYAFETGPQQVLKNLLAQTSLKINVLSMDSEKDYNSMLRLFCAGSSNRMDKISEFLKIAVGTRNNGLWDNDQYHRQVVVPFRELKRLFLDLEKRGEGAEVSDVLRAAELLQAIVTAKNPFSPGERDNIIKELFTDLELLNPLYKKANGTCCFQPPAAAGVAKC